jgi:transmembrane sensor
MKRLNTEIKAVIVRVLSNESSLEDDFKLMKFINESEQNLLAFKEYERISNDVDVIFNRKLFNSEKAFSELNLRIKTASKRTDSKNSIGVGKIYFNASKWAAVILMLIGFGILIGYLEISTDKNTTALYEIVSPAGARSQVRLPDGTNVWLNSGSKLEYRKDFDIKNRTVFLSGEGYFEVAKNTGKPFIVITSEIEITALGTIFNVKSYPEEDIIETTLIEGLVKLNREADINKQNGLLLKPNQQVTYFKKTGMISGRTNTKDSSSLLHEVPANKNESETKNKVILNRHPDINAVIAWKDNKLIFEDETFSKIAVKLERRFNVNIVFNDDGAAQNYRFSGRFDNVSIEQALNALELASPLFSFTIEGDTIYIVSH